MSGLERLRLSSKRREASSLLAIESPAVLATLGATAAWWTCHDEGDLDAMVSIVTVDGDRWSVRPIEFETGRRERTDAEALARSDGSVFVFGSGFTDKSGQVDRRRAFIARFRETAAIAGPTRPDVLDLGTDLLDSVTTALGAIALLEADEPDRLINIEGAAFVGDDLFLGLRWPVSDDGQPLLVRVAKAAAALTAPDWSVETFTGLEMSAHAVDVGASPKRPAGVRGLTAIGSEVHLVVGQTERSLTAKKVKSAAARHVRVDVAGSSFAASDVETFEGFRKVEGVAPAPGGGWLYALDDEDAIVLVTVGVVRRRSRDS